MSAPGHAAAGFENYSRDMTFCKLAKVIPMAFYITMPPSTQITWPVM